MLWFLPLDLRYLRYYLDRYTDIRVSLIVSQWFVSVQVMCS